MDKMKEQNTEGCRIGGRVRVKKVGFPGQRLLRVDDAVSRSLETCISAPGNPFKIT